MAAQRSNANRTAVVISDALASSNPIGCTAMQCNQNQLSATKSSKKRKGSKSTMISTIEMKCVSCDNHWNCSKQVKESGLLV